MEIRAIYNFLVINIDKIRFILIKFAITIADWNVWKSYWGRFASRQLIMSRLFRIEFFFREKKNKSKADKKRDLMIWWII